MIWLFLFHVRAPRTRWWCLLVFVNCVIEAWIQQLPDGIIDTFSIQVRWVCFFKCRQKWTELRTGCHMDVLKLGIFSFTFCCCCCWRKLVESVFRVDDLILILLAHRAHMLNMQWRTKCKGCIAFTWHLNRHIMCEWWRCARLIGFNSVLKLQLNGFLFFIFLIKLKKFQIDFLLLNTIYHCQELQSGKQIEEPSEINTKLVCCVICSKSAIKWNRFVCHSIWIFINYAINRFTRKKNINRM